MRIISGRFRGKKLHPVGKAMIRPTSDRVREAIFNIIFSGVAGKNVLDLFAGTGAMGIEALSRGATHAVFVESAPASLFVLSKNLADLPLEGRADIVGIRLPEGIRRLVSKGPFELVFMDPPYRECSLIEPVLSGLHQSGCLAAGAVLVLEHSFKETPLFPDAFVLNMSRKYGKTLVSFLEYVI